jgi:hypothetical protein
MAKIRQLRWEAGIVIPEKYSRDILSQKEYHYFLSYSDILSEYFESIDLDLSENLKVF